MTDPRLTARRIVHLIQTHRIDVTTEGAAHRGILSVIAADMPDTRSEVRLWARCVRLATIETLQGL
jgi:hypothetical protein